MNWIKKIIRTYGVTVLISALIIYALESVSSIAYYQLKKPSSYSFSSTVAAFQKIEVIQEIISRTETQVGPYDKLVEINNNSKNGNRIYPSYLYEPQFHNPSEFYFLANIANSRIIDCNEAGYFNYWKSDHFGFRNPPDLHKSHSDILLIGDSFSEGACENETGTIAGYLRSKGLKVANLGRSGSGPLFQLASLVEYAPQYKSDTIVWIIFTGNDLQNLREEKTTRLSAYLDTSYSQNLAKNKVEVNTDIERFLETQINNSNVRMKSGLPLIRNPSYGQSLDLLDAESIEASLLIEVASRVLSEVKKVNAKLKIVILNHVEYEHDVQDLTSKVIKEFAGSEEIDYLDISREYLTINKHLYTKGGPHFNKDGYRAIGEEIRTWLNNGGDKIL